MTATSPSVINVQWKAWSAAYAARSRREKIILGLAGLALVYTLVDQVWLTPSLNALGAQRKAVAQKQADLSQINTQIAQLLEQTRQRDTQLASALEVARQDVGDVSSKLAEFERTLVPARHMAEFLRGLMPGSTVEVIALKTLPPTPLVQRQPPKEGEASGVAPGSAKAAQTDNLYKHGVEITLAGSYPALLDYLSRLESSRQKVLWGGLQLSVEQHPRSELRLVLYTLSLDPAWLAV